jgi:hypothetical protein
MSRWNPKKSTTLTIVVAWVGLVLAAACVPLLPFASRWAPMPGSVIFGPDQRSSLIPMYGCLLFGLIALGLLQRMLYDIRAGQVFTKSNVLRLQVISWCGWAIFVINVAAVIFLHPQPVYVVLAAAAGFAALLMRVIKNVIEAARLLKEDVDFTI